MACLHKTCRPQHFFHSFRSLASVIQDQEEFDSPLDIFRENQFRLPEAYPTNTSVHFFGGVFRGRLISLESAQKFFSSICNPFSLRYDRSINVLPLPRIPLDHEDGVFLLQNCEDQLDVKFFGLNFRRHLSSALWVRSLPDL